MNLTKKMTLSASISEFLATVAMWFASAGFIMWGWNTLAPYINCPLFTYWEIFAMRVGLSFFMTIIWQKKK